MNRLALCSRLGWLFGFYEQYSKSLHEKWPRSFQIRTSTGDGIQPPSASWLEKIAVSTNNAAVRSVQATVDAVNMPHLLSVRWQNVTLFKMKRKKTKKRGVTLFNNGSKPRECCGCRHTGNLSTHHSFTPLFPTVMTMETL